MLASSREHLACRLDRPSDSAEVLTQYLHDFGGYCRDILKAQLWQVEVDIGQGVHEHPRTAVAGCHASGKTFVAGSIANWWLDTRDPAIVLNTAPVGRQAKLGVFREATKSRRKAALRLPGRIMTAEIRISDQRFMLAFSADNPDAVQGLREACNVLVIEDEATGVDDEMIEALETVLTDPSSRYLMQGNPVSQSGHFFDAFHARRDMWHCININAFDTPNVQAGKIVVPGLISTEFVDSRRKKWGEDSPQWHQRILGQFYILAGATKVLSRDWIDQAAERFSSMAPAGSSRRIMAVDIAASEHGDQTANYMMEDRRISEVETYHEPNLLANAARIVQQAIERRVQVLNIDATGLGVGCFQEVERLATTLMPDVEVNGINLGDAASEKIYRKLLSELQWKMRREFDPDGAEPVAIDPDDTELREQLGWRQWDLIDGVICVESKNKLRQRTGKSPDKSDAVMLLFYEGKRLVFV